MRSSSCAADSGIYPCTMSGTHEKDSISSRQSSSSGFNLNGHEHGLFHDPVGRSFLGTFQEMAVFQVHEIYCNKGAVSIHTSWGRCLLG